MYSMSYFWEGATVSDSSTDTLRIEDTGKIVDLNEGNISVNEDVTDIRAHPEYINPLPFPKMSAKWYERQYALSIHNTGSPTYHV